MAISPFPAQTHPLIRSAAAGNAKLINSSTCNAGRQTSQNTGRPAERITRRRFPKLVLLDGTKQSSQLWTGWWLNNRAETRLTHDPAAEAESLRSSSAPTLAKIISPHLWGDRHAQVDFVWRRPIIGLCFWNLWYIMAAWLLSEARQQLVDSRLTILANCVTRRRTLTSQRSEIIEARFQQRKFKTNGFKISRLQ